MAGLRRYALLVALAAAVSVSGCGKKGPLIPPEALVPAPVKDLAVAQKGGEFQVTWSAPSREEGGARLTDLAGFLLFRRPVLPPDQDCEECPTAYRQLAQVDLDFPQRVKKIDGHYLYDDYDLIHGKTYQYKVRSFTTDHVQSKDSNKVRRSVVSPPQPPVLEAASSADGVVLSFVVLPPPEGSISAYDIYRAEEGAAMPATPRYIVPAAAKTFEDKDVLIGTRYSYWVTAVAKVKAETVESAPSNEASAALSERD